MLWLTVVTLLLSPQAGEKCTVTFDSSLELDIVVRDGKGEAQRVLNLQRKEKFNQTQVDAKNFRIECVSSTLQKSGTDTPIEEKPTALAGQTYVALQTESGWLVRDTQGNSAPAEGVSLGSWNEAGKLLPAGDAPKQGDKWAVEGRDLVAILLPRGVPEPTGKLECACESVEGGKVKVLFGGTITGKSQDAQSTSTITLTVKEGVLVFDAEKKKPVSLKISGGYESQQDMNDVVRRAGTGTSVNNEEERRKVGEITVKSRKLEASVTFE